MSSRSIRAGDIAQLTNESSGVAVDYLIIGVDTSDRHRIIITLKDDAFTELKIIITSEGTIIEGISEIYTITYKASKSDWKKPTVICLKGKRDILGPSIENLPEDHVYIGRNLNMGGWRMKKSKWANPFSVKQYGRDQALDKYRTYILETPTLMESLYELNGKVLACWCHPDPCHGHILAELFENKFLR